ncbi:protein of unknown function [Legionella fallonii LLAP-10]|uniref:Uncharacterized protein n=1 Tax=Legionella fallonii LLAP-10 TaxID=1212491 RepID=A0A098G1Y0_9GAMM|nr:protein of unknown function [Legionella fallonii LLAP-10]
MDAPGSVLKLIYHLLRGIVEKTIIKSEGTTFLLNTGHVGLDQSDYQRLMRKKRVKPVFLYMI